MRSGITMGAWRSWLWALALLVAAAMCSCSAGGGADDDDDGAGGTGLTGTGTGLGGADFDGGSGGNTNCSEASKLVYVIDQDNMLYSFDPLVQSPAAFQPVGVMNCQGDGPNSMAVSRDGFAFVLYGNQDAIGNYECVGVYRVSTENASCLGLTPFACGTEGFSKFGMGYATDGANTTNETLFLGNSLSAGLGTLDVATGAVQFRGTLPNQGPEFTGNAAGELWGFFPYDTPPNAIQLDPLTGNALQTLPLGSLPSVNSGTMAAWAFAFWGGSFYIFYRVDPPDSSSHVYKLEYDGSLTMYIPNTGLTIVGAGVSTCAPLVPPR